MLLWFSLTFSVPSRSVSVKHDKCKSLHGHFGLIVPIFSSGCTWKAVNKKVSLVRLSGSQWQLFTRGWGVTCEQSCWFVAAVLHLVAALRYCFVCVKFSDCVFGDPPTQTHTDFSQDLGPLGGVMVSSLFISRRTKSLSRGDVLQMNEQRSPMIMNIGVNQSIYTWPDCFTFVKS